jgi:hypothetical protein
MILYFCPPSYIRKEVFFCLGQFELGFWSLVTQIILTEDKFVLEREVGA